MAAANPEIPELHCEHDYPRELELSGHTVVLRQLASSDAESVLEFAGRLSEEDLLFLRNDITRPEVVSAWIAAVEGGERFTVLAEHAGRLVGYGSLDRPASHWTRHLGNVRLLVDAGSRGIGLGRVLASELMRVAARSGLRKLVAQMPRDQTEARTVFRRLGFDLESMLAGFVIDREGATRDLVVMVHDLVE